MAPRNKTLLSGTAAAFLLLALSGGASVLVHSSQGNAAVAQCQDGIDNDGDGRIDYPNDPDCSSPDDNDEYSGGGAVFVSITDGKDRIAAGGSLIYAVTLSTNDNNPETATISVSLPSELGIVSVSNGGNIVTPTLVRWDNVTVSRNQPVTYTIQTNVNPHTQNGTNLVTTATAGGYNSADSTLVQSTGNTSGTNPSFDIFITDNETSVLPDTDLDYTITVDNLMDFPETTDVRATLSPFLAYVVPDDSTASVDSSRILWSSQSFGPHQTRVYHFTARTVQRPQRNEIVRVAASVNGANDSDTTEVRSSATPHNMSLNITDGHVSAAVGDTLTYTITLHNNENTPVADAYLSAAMPIYSEFLGASGGAQQTSSNVRWPALSIGADSDRTVSFTVRVRPDAPLGDDLLASASVDGVTDYDHTQVTLQSSTSPASSSSNPPRLLRPAPAGFLLPPPPVPTSSAAPRPSSNSSYYRPTSPQSARPSANVLLQKTADRSSVLPGGVVRFRLIVNNITGSPLSGLTVNDRFDQNQFSVVDAGGGNASTAGTLEWTVPTLQPGDNWSVTYTLRVGASVPSGTILSNLAALNGSGLDAVALDKRLSGTKISVVSTLPTTGAPLDTMLLGVLAVFALVPLLVQRRAMR